MIHYRIELHDLHAHQYRVTLTVPQPAAEQRVSLPVWIPGSYMVREFGRHLSRLEARQGRSAVPLRPARQDQLAGGLRWPRRADAELPGVCLRHLGARRISRQRARLLQRHQPVPARRRPRERGARVALARPAARLVGGHRDAGRRGARAYVAADYDELVDHPFELGPLLARPVSTAPAWPHEFVVAGAWPGFDGERLLADARRICETQIAFWHGQRKAKPPFARYVFLLHAVEDGYGGLEHRASTALIGARRDLPRHGQAQRERRLQHPARPDLARVLPRLERQAPEAARIDAHRLHARELHAAAVVLRGLHVLLRRPAAVARRPDRCTALPEPARQDDQRRGRHARAAGCRAWRKSSFDAWVKYYRSDENTPNATVSYYTKGSLVALALDLTLRREGRGTLDERDAPPVAQRSRGGAIDERDIAAALARSRWPQLCQGTGRLGPWHRRVAAARPVRRGRHRSSATARPRWRRRSGCACRKAHSAGCRSSRCWLAARLRDAGVAAGDELLAVDGWRIRRLDDAQQWLAAGQAFELLLVRDQRVLRLKLQPDAARRRRRWRWRLADKPDRSRVRCVAVGWASRPARRSHDCNADSPCRCCPVPAHAVGLAASGRLVGAARRGTCWGMPAHVLVADNLVGWGDGERRCRNASRWPSCSELAPAAPPAARRRRAPGQAGQAACRRAGRLGAAPPCAARRAAEPAPEPTRREPAAAAPMRRWPTPAAERECTGAAADAASAARPSRAAASAPARGGSRRLRVAAVDAPDLRAHRQLPRRSAWQRARAMGARRARATRSTWTSPSAPASRR